MQAASIARRRPRARATGFTLIELLTAITVAAIMMMVAVPSFQQFQRNSQLTSSVNALVAALGAARAEAMKRQLDVYVTPAAGGWAQGWTVWVDVDLNAAYASSSDVLILAQPPVPSTVSVTPSAGFNNDATLGNYLKFNGAGFPQTISNSTLAATQQLVFSNSTESRNVLISRTGRVRACKPDPATCDASTDW